MKTKVFFLSCIFLWSCSQTQELPQGVLNKEEMIEVLLDVYMAQAKIAKERSIERDSAEVLYRHYQDYILKQRNSDRIIYTDSRTAISWVKKKICNTKLERTDKNKPLFELVDRAVKWLNTNNFNTTIVKWETKAWGEIPADFGRK